MEEPGTSVGESGDLAAVDQGNVVSMVDVLQQNQDLEAEATAVLGDSDDKFCTYPQLSFNGKELAIRRDRGFSNSYRQEFCDAQCTESGYLARQALYACATCSSSPNPAAGVCLACSYECHEGHQLFELYTKRHFRCDCGNSSFPNLTCKLEPNKAATNPENMYNGNFRGVYCICKRPYPDPEDEVEDEMIQCVVCEEWYHGRHLGSIDVPDNEDYQEMVCNACMKKCDFLWAYSVQSLETRIVKEDTSASVDVGGNTEDVVSKDKNQVPTQATDGNTGTEENRAKNSKSDANFIKPENTTTESSEKDIKEKNTDTTIKSSTDANAPAKLPKKTASDKDNDSSTSHINSCTSEKNSKTALPNGDEPETSRTTPRPTAVHVQKTKTECKNGSENNNEACVVPDGVLMKNGTVSKEDMVTQTSHLDAKCALKELRARRSYRGDHATFWPNGWRKKLCTCESCKTMYAEKSVAFIADESDSVLAYEQRGLTRQASSVSQYEQGMQALSSMGRVQQVEMLHGFNDLKAELTDYLKDFADQGKVVKREDIDKFFDDMQARKRQRVGDVGAAVQYHCR